MGILKQSQSSELALNNYRRSRDAERRKALRHNLRMESLEHRVVFAGVSPVAVNDLYEAIVDEPLQVETSGVLANDLDVDGDALTAEAFLGPKHGELSFNSDGTFSYQPDPGFEGFDGFVYQVDDGSSKSQFAAVTIQVTDPNVAPEGSNDFFSLEEDSVLTLLAEDGVLANDHDANGDSLTVELMDATEHGTVELQEDGSFVFTPDPDFYGTDAFTYRISDGAKTSDLVVVELNIEPVADAPVAAGESLTVLEDGILDFVSEDLLANDFDVDSESLEIVMQDGPTHGTLDVQPDGSFQYTPEADYHGTDSFTYRVSDGAQNSELVTAEIIVTAVNDAPIAGDDSLETDEGMALSITPESLLENDSDLEGDLLNAELAEAPENGTLELDDQGNWVYTPAEGFAGMDEFSYFAMDGSDSSLATVSVMVHEVAQDPIANNEAYVATSGVTLSIDAEEGLLANDIEDASNPEPLAVEVFRGPEHGELEVQPDGSFDYTPDEDFSGIDSIIYRAHEGELDSHLAVATLYVNASELEPAPEPTPEIADNSIPPMVDPTLAPSVDPVGEDGSAGDTGTPIESLPVENMDDSSEEFGSTEPQEEQNPWQAFFSELDDFWFEITCFFG